ncbi:Ig-like domain repeat protein [Terriglobus saanensis]|uniref:NHL repeat containing protein n=1 Tax=Terriglobus saanensis (strain ATCC BAA-1853 / DSM 23119 / SP1PR4) TaxID=401053 RepID=E8V320_TERSS|nr:Ig-like domain repeat protein [Terriglobus saanensis]ADV81295.1 NHL repeat containing protein [Terriglobus saanensis SP1PR4]
MKAMILKRFARWLPVALALLLTTTGRGAFAQAVTLVPIQTKFAGTGAGTYNGDFGSADFVSLNGPAAVALDSSGNTFISDRGNNCVRRIDAATGSVTTLLGLVSSGTGDSCNTATNATPSAAQGLYQPGGIVIDSNDSLYIADTGHNCVRMLPSHTTGTTNLVTVAGTCTSVNTPGATTPGSSTPQPNMLAIDSANQLYVSILDAPDSVYQVLRHTSGDLAATVCRVAGAASTLAPANCTGVSNSVALNAPVGIAFDPAGGLYIADTGNNCVREEQGGTISTVLGTCANDSTSSGTAAIVDPRGLVFNSKGELFVSEGSANQLLRFNASTKSILRLAGDPTGASGAYIAAQNGTGSQSIPLHTPLGLAFDAGGDLYLADSDNSVVRKFSFSTRFGQAPIGSAASAQLVTFTINNPTVNLSVSAGADYVVDGSTCTGALTGAASGSLSNFCTVTVSFHPTFPGLRSSALRVADSVSGNTVLVALQGTGTGSQPVFAPGVAATSASAISNPVAVTVDSAGNAYVLNAAPGGASLSVTGSGGVTQTAIPTSAGLVNPVAITSDGAGNFYIADGTTGKIVQFGADGSVTPEYVTGLVAPTAIALDVDGNLVIAEAGSKHDLVKAFVGGQRLVLAGAGANTSPDNVLATTAMLQTPSGVRVGPSGNVFFADAAAHRVYAIDTAGQIHFLAGNGTTTTSAVGAALGTGLVQPTGVDLDAAGDVLITDPPANLVYVVYSSTQQMLNLSVILGTGVAGNTGDGALATSATVNGPVAVATASSGALYVVDAGNKSLRSVTFPATTLDFGDVAIGGTVSLVQQLWNRGNQAFIRTTDPVISDSHFANDATLNTCGQSVGLGATCNFGFSFSPTAIGPVSATGQLVNVAYNSPQVVNLTGVGTGAIITITAPVETEVYGAPYVGTVHVVSNGGVAATGTVTFSVNGVVLCATTGAVTGDLSCTKAAGSGLNVGTYPVQIAYSGDTTYPARTLTTTLTVTPATISVVVGSQSRDINSANPTLTGVVTGVVAGQSVTPIYTTTATTTSPAGTYPITATVTFGAGTLATNYVVQITPGVLTIYIPVTMTLASSGNPSTVGQSVTFTSTVVPVAGTAAGTVVFFDGTVSVATVPVSSTGVATYTTSILTLGTHAIVALFRPSTLDFRTASGSLIQVVDAVPVPVGAFSVSATPDTYLVRGKGSVVYTARVTPGGGFAGPVALTCSGLPADATCVFATPTVNVSTAVVDTAFTVSVTEADAASLRMPASPAIPTMAPIYAAAVFPMGLSGLGVFAFGARRRRRGQKNMLLFVLIGLVMVGLAGCGCPTSSFKTYSVTVTGTSVNGGPAASSATVSITVATPTN